VLLIQPVFAAAPVVATQNEKTFGFHCVDGVCRAQLDLGIPVDKLPQGAWLTVMQNALRSLPDGMSVGLNDDVTLTLPTGKLSLADADLVVKLDDAGKITTMHGSASALVPTFGLLGDWQFVTPARLSVGYERGDALSYLNAPLQADHRYFYFDAETGMNLSSKEMTLTSQPGQRAAIVVDFMQPLLFIDGQVTLHTGGQMAFIRQALGPVANNQWMPLDLPLHQSVLVHLQGQVGRDVEPKLTLAGEYRVDGGLVAKWMQVDATPLVASGQAMIGPKGLALEGSARSALKPDQFFDGGAKAHLFVPFDTEKDASVSIGADVALPAIGVQQDASASAAGGAGWLRQSTDAAMAGVQSGLNTVGSAAQSGYAWMSQGVGTGWAYTQEKWCSLIRNCNSAAGQQANVITAQR
jgi:hypothetical protein